MFNQQKRSGFAVFRFVLHGSEQSEESRVLHHGVTISMLIHYYSEKNMKLRNYRIGITLDKTRKLLLVERVAHRKDIYKIFP